VENTWADGLFWGMQEMLAAYVDYTLRKSRRSIFGISPGVMLSDAP
jgi:hypothetical protein